MKTFVRLSFMCLILHSSSCQVVRKDGIQQDLSATASGKSGKSAAAKNWCFPAAGFEAVPVNTPFLSVICGNSVRCQGDGSILKLDERCNPVVDRDMEAGGRALLVKDVKSDTVDFSYVIVDQVNLSQSSKGVKYEKIKDYAEIPCKVAAGFINLKYKGKEKCRVERHDRIDGQYTLTIFKLGETGITADAKKVSYPKSKSGSNIARDLTKVSYQGHGVVDLMDAMLEDLKPVDKFDENMFVTHENQIQGCLLNSRIVGHSDIQAYLYCRLPHHARRCFGGLMNRYKLYCPIQKMDSDPAYVKSYTPDFKTSFRICFGSHAAFKNESGESFDYFTKDKSDSTKEFNWKGELFLKIFDSVEGFRDYSIASQNSVIASAALNQSEKLSSPGRRYHRIVDLFTGKNQWRWQADQERYNMLAAEQRENQKAEALYKQKLKDRNWAIDKVLPACPGERFIPELGGEPIWDFNAPKEELQLAIEDEVLAEHPYLVYFSVNRKHVNLNNSSILQWVSSRVLGKHGSRGDKKIVIRLNKILGGLYRFENDSNFHLVASVSFDSKTSLKDLRRIFAEEKYDGSIDKIYDISRTH
ncbi:MAG: hypothetical protein R3B45_18060 [Bdellovibrionota bacterium]